MVSEEAFFHRLKLIDRKYSFSTPKPAVTDAKAYIEYMTKKLEWYNAKFFLLKEIYKLGI